MNMPTQRVIPFSSVVDLVIAARHAHTALTNTSLSWNQRTEMVSLEWGSTRAQTRACPNVTAWSVNEQLWNSKTAFLQLIHVHDYRSACVYNDPVFKNALRISSISGAVEESNAVALITAAQDAGIRNQFIVGMVSNFISEGGRDEKELVEGINAVKDAELSDAPDILRAMFSEKWLQSVIENFALEHRISNFNKRHKRQTITDILHELDTIEQALPR
jgi:hypothetical protein